MTIPTRAEIERMIVSFKTARRSPSYIGVWEYPISPKEIIPILRLALEALDAKEKP